VTSVAREFATVGVVGLGTMGAGIVEVFARSGLDVVASEVDPEALARGRATLNRSVDRAVSRGRLAPAEREALLSRAEFTVGLEPMGRAELVVEAVPERLDLKRTVVAELDRICPPGTVLATNTSSLSVTEIAAATGRPRQVMGMHFFNPAPVMRLVELVRTVVTDPAVEADLAALCARLGKVAVRVGDRAGFIANWLLFGYLNRAAAMVETGYATREDIDTAMRLGAGLPMGPLALLDLIGLDTSYQILRTMYRRGGRDRRHAPTPLLADLVAAGLLGRKSGRGFYTYDKPGSAVVVDDELTPRPQAAAGRPQSAAARPVARVGLVGSGATADRIAALLAAGGHVTVPVTGPGDTAWQELSDADLVVVTVSGPPEAELLAAAGAVAAPGAVLAVATARERAAPPRPVIETAVATGRPGDVVGLHLPGLDPAATLVEVVRTVRTAPEALATARAAVTAAGHTPVACPDRPGFIVDSLLFPYLNDAVRMLEAGYAGVADIDAAMRLGCGYPAGPFQQLDSVGLDTALAVQRALHRAEPEPGMAPVPLLEQLVTAGAPVTAAA
jgi:3-hydroxybutyryl-CoA dehydrogenase